MTTVEWFRAFTQDRQTFVTNYKVTKECDSDVLSVLYTVTSILDANRGKGAVLKVDVERSTPEHIFLFWDGVNVHNDTGN